MNKQRMYKAISTYAAVILLPLIIILPLYFFISHTLNSELERSNNYLLNTLKVGMDAYVQETRTVISDLAADSELEGMLGMPYLDKSMTVNVSQKLGDIKRDSFYVKDAYILFPNHNCVLGDNGLSGVRDYFIDTKGMDSESYFAFRKILGKKYKNNFLKSTDMTVKSGSLVCVCSMPTDEIGILKAQIVIELDISEIIKSMNFKEQHKVFICDNNKFIVYSDKSAEIEKLIPKVKGNGVYSEGVAYNISSIEAGFNDLTYYIAVKRDEYIRPLVYIRYVIVLLLLLSVTFIVFSARKIKTEQSRRIIKVLELFEKGNVKEASYDELYNRVDKLICERENLDRELGKHIAGSRENYIQKLLKDRITEREKNNKIFSHTKEHIIAVVRTDNYGNLYFDADYGLTELEKLQEAHLIADNILMEYFSDSYTALSTEVDDELVFVIEGNDLSEYAIEEKIRKADEKTNSFFGFSLRYAVKRVTKGEYADAYRSALDSIPENEEEYFSEQKLSSAGEKDFFCFYPAEVEEKILTMLKSKRYEGAKAEIRRIIDVNFDNKNPVSASVNLFFMSLINTMTRAVAGNEIKNSKKIYSLINSLVEVSESDVLYDGVVNLIDEIEIEAVDEQDQDVQFKEKVSMYIGENFTDMNINLDMIAEYMNVNPSYLSRKFKKQFREGILEYIYKMRIEKAKEYLDGGENVSKTAISVGFATERAFVRAFIKYVGVTPSQYKKS